MTRVGAATFPHDCNEKSASGSGACGEFKSHRYRHGRPGIATKSRSDPGPYPQIGPAHPQDGDRLVLWQASRRAPDPGEPHTSPFESDSGPTSRKATAAGNGPDT